MQRRSHAAVAARTSLFTMYFTIVASCRATMILSSVRTASDTVCSERSRNWRLRSLQAAENML